MTLHDITLPLHSEHPPWPGDTPFSMQPSSRIANGDNCNVSTIRLSTHFGTHLDAPYHFEDDGARVHQLDLDVLVGPALVHEVDAADLVRPEHLPPLQGVERILFKTKNSAKIADAMFHTDYVSIGLETAVELNRAGVRLVGIDYFSVEAFKNPSNPVHHEFCGNGVILVEGLDLRAVSAGRYELIVLPLKLQDGDGSPCRAILRDLST